MSAGGERKSAAPGGGGEASDTIAGWMQAIAPYGIFTTDVDLRIQYVEPMVGQPQAACPRRKSPGRTLAEVFPDLEGASSC